jgi:hypothetical protein
MHRFIADWIIDMDDMGTDKSASSVHDNLEEATRHAVAASKKAGVIEWVRVREQEWNKHTHHWDTVKRWVGDWDYQEESA